MGRRAYGNVEYIDFGYTEEEGWPDFGYTDVEWSIDSVPPTNTPEPDQNAQYSNDWQLERAANLVDKYGGWVSWSASGYPVAYVLEETEPQLKAPAPRPPSIAPPTLDPDISSAAEQVTRVTKLVQERAAASYVNICQEVSHFLYTTEKMEREIAGLTEEERAELLAHRMAYMDKLQRSFQDGQEVIRHHLRAIRKENNGE